MECKDPDGQAAFLAIVWRQFLQFLFLFRVPLSTCNSQDTPMSWCRPDILSRLGFEWSMFNLTIGKPNSRVLILNIFPPLSLRSSPLIVGSPALPGCLVWLTSRTSQGLGTRKFSGRELGLQPERAEVCLTETQPDYGSLRDSPQHTCCTHRGLGCHLGADPGGRGRLDGSLPDTGVRS